MGPLSPAVTAATSLARALRAEVERVRKGRALLSGLKASEVLEFATGRTEFLETASSLQARIHAGVKAAAGESGLTAPDGEALERAFPEDGAALNEQLSEIRALAGALRELDELNQKIATRTLSVLRFVDRPRGGVGYDRSGGESAAGAPARVSARG